VIPNDEELEQDLTERKNKIVNSNGRIRIEETWEMRKRPVAHRTWLTA
jgi:hypothetical protein